jgi:hypothetical protein
VSSPAHHELSCPDLRYTSRANSKLVFLAVLLAIPTPSVLLSAQQATPVAPDDLDVYERVIRFQITSWELPAQAFCIQVNRRDPDKALLKRFPALPVEAASACGEIDRKTALMRVVDKKTKKNAVIFDVGVIRRLSSSEIEVEGGYVCGSLCMAGGIYHLVREESGWRVTGFQWQIMS